MFVRRSMHKPIFHSSNKDFEDYYLSQAGNGVPVFSGPRTQRGHGLGSVLGGLFKSASPLLKQGAKLLGKHALKTGIRVASDVAAGKDFKTAAKAGLKSGLKKTASDLTKLAVKRLRPPGDRQTKRRKQDIFDKYNVFSA